MKFSFDDDYFKRLNFKQSDFVNIKTIKRPVNLCYNINDQFLYILKEFQTSSSLNEFNHEITFYKKINNKNPYISKYFGVIYTPQTNIIIIEYIEGETLLDFVANNKNSISFNLKMRIISDLLIAIDNIHSNNIILRDLKYDNIMIDSTQNAILIDFDKSKLLEFNETEIDENEITGDITSRTILF